MASCCLVVKFSELLNLMTKCRTTPTNDIGVVNQYARVLVTFIEGQIHMATMRKGQPDTKPINPMQVNCVMTSFTFWSRRSTLR